MSEGTYEYECMRAELLGVEPISEEEFLKKLEERQAAEDEERETKNLEAAEATNEEIRNIGGGLEDLNNLLAVTQKKLNRFKNACGNFTSLLKTRLGSVTSMDSIHIAESDEKQQLEQELEEEEKETCKEENFSETPKKNQGDKLDSILEKADNALYSMSHQNKQMKSFLK